MSDTVLVDVTLHDVGEGLAEAQIVEWLVSPGQPVTEDQTIVLISTDKATVELPAPTSGILYEHAVPVGATVTVGTLLARIESSREAAARLSPSHTGSAVATAQMPQSSAGTASTGPVATVAAAPSTRRLAQQLNIDIARITGTGPNGRILDEDVRRAAEGDGAKGTASVVSSVRTSLDGERVPLNRTRLATARSTTAAWREVPHIVEFRQIDASALKQARDTQRAAAERDGIRLTFLPFFVKATAIAMAKHPSFNARLDLEREELIQYRQCNIGIATAGDAGLIVPVLHDVERHSVLEIARALDALIDRARKQVLSLADLSDGTFTITNFGSYGTWLGTPIIRAPEVAIAGFGRIQDGVLAVGGAPVVRPILPLSVAVDHRVNDGVHLAAFLDTLTELFSDPSRLLS